MNERQRDRKDRFVTLDTKYYRIIFFIGGDGKGWGWNRNRDKEWKRNGRRRRKNCPKVFYYFYSNRKQRSWSNSIKIYSIFPQFNSFFFHFFFIPFFFYLFLSFPLSLYLFLFLLPPFFLQKYLWVFLST